MGKALEMWKEGLLALQGKKYVGRRDRGKSIPPYVSTPLTRPSCEEILAATKCTLEGAG